jgi:hypothetical protein
MEVKTQIPKLIRIGRRKYSIEVVEAMLEKSYMGKVNYHTKRISIGTHSNKTGKPFTQDQIDNTFWHEVTHAILYEMNHNLYANEKFVTEFSNRLAEAIKTARF